MKHQGLTHNEDHSLMRLSPLFGGGGGGGWKGGASPLYRAHNGPKGGEARVRPQTQKNKTKKHTYRFLGLDWAQQGKANKP